jgi:hypothetical protein
MSSYTNIFVIKTATKLYGQAYTCYKVANLGEVGSDYPAVPGLGWEHYRQGGLLCLVSRVNVGIVSRQSFC